MDFNKIIEKYNYPEDFSLFLKQVYDAFVEKFGIECESLIYQAFLETPIIFVNNIYNGIMDYKMDDDIEGLIVQESDYKMASGVYTSKPNIIYNRETDSFSVVGVQRYVFVTGRNWKEDYKKGNIIHELGHLVKGYFEEYDLDGDLLTEHNGFIETQIRLSVENGQVKKTLVYEKGVGLEEGLNALLEKEIAQKIVNPEYRVSGYGVVKTISEQFLELFNPYDVLESQVHNGKDAFVYEFDSKNGIGTFEQYERLVDKIYRLGLDMFGYIFEPEKMQAKSQEINQVLREQYHPLMEEITTNLTEGGR